MTTLPAASPAIHWSDDNRRVLFERWLEEIAPRHGLRPETLAPASSDASFRRYFRIEGAGSTHIVMDAPPTHEDVRPFIHVAGLLADAALNVPRIEEQSQADGFLLMSDLGQHLYLDSLLTAQKANDATQAKSLMRDATAALVQLQARADASTLPPYDDALLRRELQLFPDWCVQREFGRTWTETQESQWRAACDLLVASALAQPVAMVHRDYMPRNLMLSDPNPGILDFQDAVRGPISYDVASLLRDAFISWEEDQEIDWAVRYWELAKKSALPVPSDFSDFWRQVEWMGLQRHLKVLGIFCRLKLRDAKPKYSQDLPRFFRYAHRVAVRYNGLGRLAKLIEDLLGDTRTDVFY